MIVKCFDHRAACDPDILGTLTAFAITSLAARLVLSVVSHSLLHFALGLIH
jgi:hypothetical protein